VVDYCIGRAAVHTWGEGMITLSDALHCHVRATTDRSSVWQTCVQSAEPIRSRYVQDNMNLEREKSILDHQSKSLPTTGDNEQTKQGLD